MITRETRSTGLDHSSGDDRTFTLVYAVITAASAVGVLMTARRESVRLRDTVVAATSTGLTLLLLATSPNLPARFRIGGLLGLTRITFVTSSTSLVQLVAEPPRRGRVLALQAIVFFGGTPFGARILGWICERFDARVRVLVGALSCLVSTGYGWRPSTGQPRRAVDRERWSR